MSERTEILDPLSARFPLNGHRFSRWAAVREVKLGSGAGKLDLTVVTDEPSILLIEAKLSRAPDAKDKVLGQLLFYLAHALEYESDIIASAVSRAATHAANQKPGFWNGVPRRQGEPNREEVGDWIRRSLNDKHRSCVHPFIALDQWNDTHDDKRLLVPVKMLLKHGLPVSIILATGELKFPRAASLGGAG